MKKISVARTILYCCVYLVFFITNFFIRPYPAELTGLGIKTDVDADAVLSAFMINVFLLLVATAILLYIIRGKKHKDFFLIVFIALNICMIFYWFRYM